MKHLPLIIGYGGMNSAGISSSCQGYRNMVFPALGTAEQEKPSCLFERVNRRETQWQRSARRQFYPADQQRYAL